MTIEEVIAELEKASEGSRELDAAIYIGLDESLAKWKPDAILCSSHKIPAYTTSLDAAMTLVPEGWIVEDAYWSKPSLGDGSGLWTLASEHQPTVEETHDSSFIIALCIAAIKARSRQP